MHSLLSQKNIVIAAQELAEQYHAKQRRDDGSPYIGHLKRVVRTLQQNHIDDDAIIAAAWLQLRNE